MLNCHFPVAKCIWEHNNYWGWSWLSHLIKLIGYHRLWSIDNVSPHDVLVAVLDCIRKCEMGMRGCSHGKTYGMRMRVFGLSVCRPVVCRRAARGLGDTPSRCKSVLLQHNKICIDLLSQQTQYVELLQHWNMETKGVFQFEIITNVLVSYFRFIWIHMLWVYDHYKYIKGDLSPLI